MTVRQAVVLAGGRGTRLGAATADTPKPLLPVGGLPFLEYLLRQIARHGFEDVLLLCGYRAESFDNFLSRRRPATMRVRVSREPEQLLGTAGALRHALALLDDAFLLLNGDTFFDINLLDLATAGEHSDKLATLALRQPVSGGRFGTVRLDGETIAAFHSPEDRIPGPINGGIYFVRRQLVERMDEMPASLEQDIFPQLAATGRLGGKVYDRPFIDIGVPADLAYAHSFVPALHTRAAAFLDRDGVLNEDLGYVHRAEDFHWKPGAKEAIKLLNDRGFFVMVVTNQAGVARGYYEESAVVRLHDWINGELRSLGAHVDAFEYCPFHPDGVVPRYRAVSDRRKPQPGMIRDCLATWPVDAERSFLIGDTETDLAAAAAAGIPGYRYQGGNLLEFVAGILSERSAVSAGGTG